MTEHAALLVGGPADGRRVLVASGVREVRVLPMRMAHVSPGRAQDVPCISDETVYEVVWGMSDFMVMAPRGADPQAVYARLVRGYLPEMK